MAHVVASEQSDSRLSAWSGPIRRHLGWLRVVALTGLLLSALAACGAPSSAASGKLTVVALRE